MKVVFNRVVAAIVFLALGVTGCSDQSNFRTDGTGNIKVLLPAPTESKGQYKLQVFELLAVEDIKKLSGTFAKFFLSPRVVNSQLDGDSPATRFMLNSNGEYIPTNATTQQMSAIYFHMQKFAAIDKEMGIESVNTWPRSIGIAVNMTGGMENNAYYDGDSDSILFVPYSAPDMAIALNGGILAHEHFHSLFYKLVLAKDTPEVHDRRKFFKNAGISDDSETENIEPNDPQEPQPDFSNRGRGRLPLRSPPRVLSSERMNKAYHETLLRAMNEGLADYWGWMYTGDPDFIVKSISVIGEERSLTRKNRGDSLFLPSVSDITNFINNQNQKSESSQFDGNVISLAYELGTNYSRFFKAFAEVYSENREVPDLEARKEIGKKIVQLLPLLKKDLESKKSTDYYSTLSLVQSFLSLIPDLKMKECELIAPTMTHLKGSLAEEFVCILNEEGVVKAEVKVLPLVTPETPEPNVSSAPEVQKP